jgi:hypothetical protein
MNAKFKFTQFYFDCYPFKGQYYKMERIKR